MWGLSSADAAVIFGLLPALFSGSAVIVRGRHSAVELTRAVTVVEKEGNKIRARLQRKPTLGPANKDGQT